MLLEGDPGSTIEVGVLKFTNPEPTKVNLTRAVIHEPPVISKMLPDQIGLVQSSYFDSTKAYEIRSKVDELQKQGAKKLILDLRNNSTSAPEDGIKAANLFIDKGLIGYTLGQKSPRQNFDAVAGNAVSKLPLTVIANRGTAGGAEVLAAALLDSKRAEVVGERTYGKAGVRKAITMDDGSAVILSVAKYYSPSGKAIQDAGVTPSVAVTEAQPQLEADDDATPTEPAAAPKGEDLLLKKAIEVATKGAGQVASGGKQAPMGQSEGQEMTPLHIPAQPKK